MREAREKQSNQRIERRMEVREREQEKLKTERISVRRATGVGAFGILHNEEDEVKNDSARELENEGNETDETNSRKKKRCIVNHGARFEREMERFGALLRESEHAHLRVEEKKLSLKERRLEIDVQMRQADRGERHRELERERCDREEERESQEMIEMETSHLMMQMFRDNRK